MLVRDRMGVKPLYYYPTRDGVLFGSEPKAILANPLAEPRGDADGLRELLAFVKTPEPGRLRGHARGAPGHLVRVDAARACGPPLLGAGGRTRTPTTSTPPSAGARPAGGHRPPAAGRRRAAVHAALRRPGLQHHHRDRRRPAGERGQRPVRTFAVDFAGHTENFEPDEMRRDPGRARTCTRSRPRRRRPPRHRRSTPRSCSTRACGRAVRARLRHPERPRRHGRLAVPAVQGDPRALHGGPVRRVGRRAVRRLPVVPRPAGGRGRHLPVARAT